MSDGPVSRTSPAAWASTLATIDPASTVTPEMVMRLGEASTACARPALPFDALRLSRLPAIDVHLTEASRAHAPESDLVIRELIAEGGMGRVYLAEQRSLAREVAIKTVKDPLDAAQLDALLWEGAIAGHLDHPGVTPVHLVGTSSEGQTILVMKRIVGLRWSDLIEGGDEVWARFPMLPKDRLRAHLEILMEVSRTIHFAHSRGVVHLDIKPDNVMIGELGEVYLVDWGVATTTGPDGVRAGFVGTPMFIAPEMIAGTEAGSWTDIYLLGATLHWVLTRRSRHAGSSIAEILTSAASSAPWRYDATVPGELAQLANDATAFERAGRPADALAFRAAIATHLEHTASLALTRDGQTRLLEMDSISDRARAHRLATEARFAFQAALERWPENRDAQQGLQACLAKAVLLEIERENLAGALELEGELDEVPELVRARREDLEKLLAERARSSTELRLLKSESDLEHGGRERFKLASVFVVVGGIGMLGMSYLMNAELTMSVTFMMLPPIAGLAVLCVGVWWLRRGLLANTISRRMMVMFFLAIVVMAAHRAGAVLFPLDVAPTEVRSELMLVAAIGVGFGTFVSPKAWLIAALPVLGAIAVTIWPRWPSQVFNTASFVTLLATLYAFRPTRARSAAAGP